jgi:flagellar transcriptional activator FlhC
MSGINTKRVARHIRALRIAKDCAGYGARSRTIEYVTGLGAGEVRRLLFEGRPSAPPGRAPASPDWYHGATLPRKAEASIFLSIYRRIRDLGFGPADALVAGYKHYLHVCSTRPHISFDRAFDLASHLDGVWVAADQSFILATCPKCASEYAASAGEIPTTNRNCPFCKLVKRYPREARLQASWPLKAVDVSTKNLTALKALQGSPRRRQASSIDAEHDWQRERS